MSGNGLRDDAYAFSAARMAFDVWRHNEADDVTGRPELCDWTSWLEGWMAAELLHHCVSTEPEQEVKAPKLAELKSRKCTLPEVQAALVYLIEQHNEQGKRMASEIVKKQDREWQATI